MDHIERQFKAFSDAVVREYLVNKYDLSIEQIKDIVKGVRKRGGNRALTKVGLHANIDGFLLAWLRHKFTKYDQWIGKTLNEAEYNREKSLFNQEAYQKRQSLLRKKQ